MVDFMLMLFFAGMMIAFLIVFVIIALYAIWATIKDDNPQNEPKNDQLVR